MKSDGHRETLAIPKRARRAVDARDGGFCRMCGRWLGERRSIHHINFGGDRQGIGGRRAHDVGGLVSLCWLPGDNGCHDRAHSSKAYWAGLLLQVIASPTKVTAVQLARWQDRDEET